MDKWLNELRSKILQTLLDHEGPEFKPKQPINYRGSTINQLTMNLKQHLNNPHIITTPASLRTDSALVATLVQQHISK